MPGAFSAWGMLQSDIRHDFKMTFYGFWERIEAATLEKHFDHLEDEGRTLLEKEGFEDRDMSFERMADFRYQGQEYVLTIPIPAGSIDMAAVRSSFDEAYDRQYGHCSPEAAIEVANLRLTGQGHLVRPGTPDPETGQAEQPRSRTVFFQNKAYETSIVSRDSIAVAKNVAGPAIIEEPTTTTLVPVGWQARVISGCHIVLTRV